MNVRHVEHFISIVEHGGYRAAAQALGVTQPALTKSVASLEDELGVTLLARSRGKAATVTVFGRVVYDRGLKLLEDLSQTRRSIELLRDGYTGDIRIGFGAAMAASQIAEISAALHDKLPESMIHIRTGMQHQLLPQLRDNRLDFLVMSGVGHREIEDLEVSPLWRDPFVVLTGISHERANEKTYNRDWAPNYPWLSSERLVAANSPAAIYLGHTPKTLSPAGLDVFDTAIVARILMRGRHMTAWPARSFQDYVECEVLHAMSIPEVSGERWMSETSLIYKKGLQTSSGVQAARRIVRTMDLSLAGTVATA